MMAVVMVHVREILSYSGEHLYKLLLFQNSPIPYKFIAQTSKCDEMTDGQFGGKNKMFSGNKPVSFILQGTLFKSAIS